MIKQIKILTKAQLYHFLNINVVRFSKDKKKKAQMTGVMAVWAMVIVMACFYMGATSYGYIQLGLENVLPSYFITLSSILILYFSIFKAGNVIFQRHYYEMLCSLPVSQRAIVISRFLNMYLENLILTFVIMLPGLGVYAYFIKPGAVFYLLGIAGTLFIPLLPMTIATLFGALVTGIASRMKHKSLAASGLSILLVLGLLLGTSQMAKLEETNTKELLENISRIVTALISKVYPPAMWLGNAMADERLGKSILYFGVSIFVFVVMVIIVSANFTKISRGLYATTGKEHYQVQGLKAGSVLGALYKKELKRYFASSVYVTNTIIGPIMMVVLGATVLIMGKEQIETYIPLKGGIVEMIPFLLAACGCIMTTTCTSISMEGKEWWIIKSIPVQTKTLFDSKILCNLTLMAPFYVIAEVMLILALKPNLLQLLWLLILPIIFMIFACVFGISVNLIFPVLDWENEVTVVKQSAAAMIGGVGGALLILLCALPVVFVTQVSGNGIKLIISIVIIVITGGLYQKNAKTELKKIGE